MDWPMDLLPLPRCAELGVRPLSGLLWTLLLLFLWYCYRVGSDPPAPGRAIPGKHKSGSRRSVLSRAGSCAGAEFSDTSKVANGDRGTPCITMETGEEEQGRGYLTPVLSHALFPAQATASGRKLYAALQEYAKRYSWAGMGRVHKGLRDQVLNLTRALIAWHQDFVVPLVTRYAEDWMTSGSPIYRPLWWLSPDDPVTFTINDQFLIGDEVLVAPVIERGTVRRDIYLPDGGFQWQDSRNAQVFDGGTLLKDYPVALEEVAIFLRRRS